jgi:hypothetical protein
LADLSTPTSTPDPAMTDMVTGDWKQYGQEYETGVNQLYDDILADMAGASAGREGQFANIMSTAGRRASELGPAGGGQQAAQLQAGVMSGREIAEIQRQDSLRKAELGMTMLQQRLKQAEAAKDRSLQMAIQEMIQEMQLRIAEIQAGGEDPGPGAEKQALPLKEQYEAGRKQVQGGRPEWTPESNEPEYLTSLPPGVEGGSDIYGNLKSEYTLQTAEGTKDYFYDPNSSTWYRNDGQSVWPKFVVVDDPSELQQLNKQRQG